MEAAMRWPAAKKQLSIGFLLILFSISASSTFAQQAGSVKVLQVVGLIGVKEHVTGTLTVLQNGNLEFVRSKVKTDVAANTIQDVVTGNDSQRMIHGFVGTLTMFGPYQSGRFLSLFRSQLDTLSIKYLDANGGVHGAIFSMSPGKAEPLKKQLLAQGAHTSVPAQDDTVTGSNSKTDVAKEVKP